MSNFEEVKKKIEIWQRNPDIYLGHGKGYRKMTIHDLALQICQLFDATCQERVERIFREIDSIYHLGRNHSNDCYGVIQPSPNCLACKWQALKKQEQVSNG